MRTTRFEEKQLVIFLIIQVNCSYLLFLSIDTIILNYLFNFIRRNIQLSLLNTGHLCGENHTSVH